MRDVGWVAIGGALGSALRWAATLAIARVTRDPAFPWGTLAVNLAGSLAIGALLGLASDRGSLAPSVRLLLVTGVLGGFTTFSAFSWEALSLLRSGQAAQALGYVAGSVLGGLALAALGWWSAGRALS